MGKKQKLAMSQSGWSRVIPYRVSTSVSDDLCLRELYQLLFKPAKYSEVKSSNDVFYILSYLHQNLTHNSNAVVTFLLIPYC